MEEDLIMILSVLPERHYTLYSTIKWLLPFLFMFNLLELILFLYLFIVGIDM